MKAGAAVSTAEKWMMAAEEYKAKYKSVSEELKDVLQERDELQESLDHIAEIAAPDRVIESERLERLERMVEAIFNHTFGDSSGSLLRQLANRADQQEPPEHDDEDEKTDDDEDKESDDDEAARGNTTR